MSDKSHAEIEAEIFDLLMSLQQYAKHAEGSKASLDKASRAASRNAQQLADAKTNLQQTVQKTIRAEASAMRRASLALDWWAFIAAFLFGGLAGLAGGWYIVTTWPRVFFGG